MDIVLADTRYILFTTRAFATGIPTVLAGTPVVSAYENEGLTQITAGITLGVDHDGVVGLNLLTIVATGANGFEDNKDYSFVITTGTVGGVSVVGEVVGHFSIQRAPVNWANVSNPTTALDLSGTDIQLADTTTTNTDMRGTDNALLAADINLTGGAVDTVTTLTNKTGFSLAATGLDAIVSTATGMVEIAKAVWDRILSGATHNIAASAGRRLRSVGDATSGTVNDASATTTSFISTLTGAHDDHFSDQTLFFTDGALSGMSRIITTYISATKVITFDEPLPAAPGNGDGFDVNPVHVHTQSQIADVVWDEVITTSDHNGANSAGKKLREASATTAISSSVNDASATSSSFVTALASTGDDFWNDSELHFTSGNLEGQTRTIDSYTDATRTMTFDEPFFAAPDDGSKFNILASHVHPVSQIADGVWDEALSGHTTAGSAGKAVTDIEADTNELQTDWTNGGRLDLIIDAILAMLDAPRAEPGQGAPAANADMATKVDYLYKFLRNKKEQTATTLSIYDDSGTTVDHKSTVSDDATTATVGEVVTGP